MILDFEYTRSDTCIRHNPLILKENVGFKNPPNLNYEERTVPCHPPKSVVRGKTRVPDKITAHHISGCLKIKCRWTCSP